MSKSSNSLACNLVLQSVLLSSLVFVFIQSESQPHVSVKASTTTTTNATKPRIRIIPISAADFVTSRKRWSSVSTTTPIPTTTTTTSSSSSSSSSTRRRELPNDNLLLPDSLIQHNKKRFDPSLLFLLNSTYDSDVSLLNDSVSFTNLSIMVENENHTTFLSDQNHLPSVPTDNYSYSIDTKSVFNSKNESLSAASQINGTNFQYPVPIGYIVGMSAAGLAILTVLVIIAVCWRRQKAVLLPEHSIYNQDTTAWDNLSLHYIDNPTEFAAKDSWEDLSDDSYLASLDEVISQKTNAVMYSRKGPSSTVPNIIRPSSNGSLPNGTIANIGTIVVSNDPSGGIK